MEFIYLLVDDGCEWEDIVIFLSNEDAIKESIKYPKSRLEIFGKSDKGYVPTYNYYQNGEYF
jgi:hypothetical protein